MKVFMTLEQRREFCNGSIIEVSTIPYEKAEPILVAFNEVVSMNNSPFVKVQKKH